MRANLMCGCVDILISLAPQYTASILSGCKTVEFRRRKMAIPAGCRMWIYTKTPVARVEAVVSVAEVYQAEPATLWEAFHGQAGISRPVFDKYFAGCRSGVGIVLSNVRPLDSSISLSQLRAHLGSFHPPQFYRRLSAAEVQYFSVETAHPPEDAAPAIAAEGTTPASFACRV